MTTLTALYTTIIARKDTSEDASYTASLFAAGRAKIAQKLGEEAVECIIAATQNNRKDAISESADLLYHWLVLLADMGITPDEVMDVLHQRKGISGLDEKRSRTND